MTGHDHSLHFGRSLPDSFDAQFPVPPLQRKFRRYSHPAENLNTPVYDATRRLSGHDLGNR
jgi:hypothetical protein